MKKLSVIIVNYNVCYFLEQTLLSVRKAIQNLDVEVWMVDNASSDGSVAMVREKFPEVNLIANQDNPGFSKANNQAIRLSNSEYVLLLNPDTVVEENTFLTCCKFMEEHPDCGGLGVKMIDGKGIFLPESKRGLPTPWVAFYKIFGLSTFFKNSPKFGKYHLSYLSKEERHEIEVLSGAFMLMRKEALDKVGLLDEDFFMYGEDIDLSYRIIKGGYKNYYLPDTKIIHYKGESTKKGSLNYVFVFYQAMIIFANKHFKSNQAGLYNLLIKLAVYLRAGFALVRRFAEWVWPVALDASLIFIGMYILKTYWENNHKYVPNYYPPQFMGIAVPTYILLWLGSVYLSGGYDKPVKPGRIVRGIIVGTILISAASNFAEAFRFSRALIVLGGIWSIIALIGNRLLLHFYRHRNLRIGEDVQKRIVLVGSSGEAARAKLLLDTAGIDARICGIVNDNPESSSATEHLGKLSDLGKIADIYEASELIFCSRDLPYADILDWMERLSNRNISFRILPENSDYIIGSSSKDTQGDYYKRETVPAILEPGNVRTKRVLDVAMSVLLLILSPLLVWKIENKPGFFGNVFRVLSGHRSWVGVRGKNTAIREGILTPTDKFRKYQLDETTISRLQHQYINDYTPVTDLDIMLKGFRFLGRE